ncbi:uncharacterized RING finger protein C548.05c-like isoform X2 [Odontomachus brunneus]|uniref:uncharacterized RING finger protein C548.05c-like isoform X2 n=1 Tax=Odontomachus brunneus TaxID=486640 RepID=UPI0013F1D659|nr:uncharacterized RING finger protein C548.05c-like isoform X2 [Odontomachus brunneus]
MMDNNQEDRTVNSSLLTPIDIIDLTNESPIRATQVHKKRLENALTSGNNIPMDLSHTSKHKKKSSTVSTNLKTKHKNVTKHMEDTVTLDDTVCVSDDDKHYVTESDNGKPLPLTCPICFEPLCSKLKPTTTHCGHIFCAQCLEAHFLKSKKCPTCQRTISLKSCTRLFL